jgi:hypothetical protein
MVEPAIGIDRSRRAPGKTSIYGAGELDVVLVAPVILPDGEQPASLPVNGDPREVVRADPRTWNALLWPAAEVALRFADDDIVAGFNGARAVQAGSSIRELPLGLQCTASCWAFGLFAAVLPLLKTTTKSPLGSTTGSEP